MNHFAKFILKCLKKNSKLQNVFIDNYIRQLNDLFENKDVYDNYSFMFNENFEDENKNSSDNNQSPIDWVLEKQQTEMPDIADSDGGGD